MIPSALIYEKANLLRDKGYRDLESLACGEGIRVYREDFRDLLGMYTCIYDLGFIYLNCRLEGPLESMVFAHEIGHDQLHRDQVQGTLLLENALFDTTSRTEYEANAFAAHLLLDDNEILEHLREGMDLAAVSKLMNVNENLLLIKLTELKRLGMDLRLPFEPDSLFFQKIHI